MVYVYHRQFQVIRLCFISIGLSYDTLFSILALILLDKYTGNLGEIAIEKVEWTIAC